MKKADSRQTGSGPQIVLTPVEELLIININSGLPGMEGVPGGIPPQRVRGHTTLVECRFLCFLVFYIFFAFEVTHANHVLATAHTIPSVSFFGNWVET